MKISSHQVRAALDAYVKAKLNGGNDRATSDLASQPGVDSLQDKLSAMPEERDLLVHDLRTKVRRGRYFVSSRQIVDALLGRLAADLLKHDK